MLSSSYMQISSKSRLFSFKLSTDNMKFEQDKFRNCFLELRLLPAWSLGKGFFWCEKFIVVLLAVFLLVEGLSFLFERKEAENSSSSKLVEISKLFTCLIPISWSFLAEDSYGLCGFALLSLRLLSWKFTKLFSLRRSDIPYNCSFII